MELVGVLSVLDKFRDAKSCEIERLDKLDSAGMMPPPWKGSRLSFSSAIKAKSPGALIAEFKQASPSQGTINTSYTPEQIGELYRDHGAAAISVLTEEVYFQGSLEYLHRMEPLSIPLLRKDFIIHPLQVQETAATPAAAMLLIVRMLDDALLKDLAQMAAEHEIESVFEIFEPQELDRARKAGATIIQVNNRNLATLDVDLSLSRTMIKEKKSQELWIAASGIAKSEEAAEMRSLGFDALLVGTSLMKSQDPGKALKSLL